MEVGIVRMSKAGFRRTTRCKWDNSPRPGAGKELSLLPAKVVEVGSCKTLDKLDFPRFSTLPGGQHNASVSPSPASGGDCGTSTMRGRLSPSTSVGRYWWCARRIGSSGTSLPGRSSRGETPEVAARRELAEEIGLAAAFPLVAVGDACGLWDGRQDKVHFFELRLDRLPELQLDNREIIGARLISPSELRGMALTGPVAVYLGRTIPPGCH